MIKKKYEALMAPLLAQQQELIEGSRAATSEELQDIEDMLGQKPSQEALQDASAIEGFWLKAMKNSDVVGEEIRDNDL